MAKQYPAPPSITIDTNKKYSATFDTSKGKIVCELFAKDAPKTVNNFVFLAREGFYDGTVFHRVIADFMVQGGDPTATGRGGPGLSISKMKPRAIPISTRSARCPWPTPARTPMAASSSSRTSSPIGWTASTRFSARSPSGQDVVDKIKQGDQLKAVVVDHPGTAAAGLK